MGENKKKTRLTLGRVSLNQASSRMSSLNQSATGDPASLALRYTYVSGKRTIV